MEGKSKLEACPNVAGSVRSGQSVSGTLLSPFLHTFLGPASPSCMSSRGGTRLTSSCLLCYHEALPLLSFSPSPFFYLSSLVVSLPPPPSSSSPPSSYTQHHPSQLPPSSVRLLSHTPSSSSSSSFQGRARRNHHSSRRLCR